MQSIQSLQIPVKWVGKGVPLLPAQQSFHAAGSDFRAAIEAPVTLEPGARMAIPTGLSIALPEGYEGQIRPRSGLAFHHGITVLNSPGTIDADYRGEIKIILINLGQEDFTIQPAERIAQFVAAPVCRISWNFVEKLSDTERGSGGFGSTGKA